MSQTNSVMRELVMRENARNFDLIAHEENGSDELRVDVAYVWLTSVALKHMRTHAQRTHAQ